MNEVGGLFSVAGRQSTPGRSVVPPPPSVGSKRTASAHRPKPYAPKSAKRPRPAPANPLIASCPTAATRRSGRRTSRSRSGCLPAWAARCAIHSPSYPESFRGHPASPFRHQHPSTDPSFTCTAIPHIQFCEDFFSRSHGEHRGRTAEILISVSLCLRERFSFRSRLITRSPSKKDFPTVRENLRTEKKDSRQGREGRQGRSNHNSVFFLACLAPFARAIWLRLRRAKGASHNKRHNLACSFRRCRRCSSVTDRSGYAPSSRLGIAKNSCAIL